MEPVRKYKQDIVNVKDLPAEERKEHYANFSKLEETNQFIKNIDPNKKNIMLPKAPAPGEIIKCQICGEEMPPEAFSKDISTRKREFKWHCHNDCMMKMFELADRATHGLIADRKIR